MKLILHHAPDQEVDSQSLLGKHNFELRASPVQPSTPQQNLWELIWAACSKLVSKCTAALGGTMVCQLHSCPTHGLHGLLDQWHVKIAAQSRPMTGRHATAKLVQCPACKDSLR